MRPKNWGPPLLLEHGGREGGAHTMRVGEREGVGSAEVRRRVGVVEKAGREAAAWK